jgi:hypothetical protein
MNDEEMDETSSGLDTLRSSLSSAVRRGGPLSEVISSSLKKAGVPESIEVDYEPMPMEERRAPSRDTRYRDELMAQIEAAKQKLLTPKPEPKTLLDKLYRQFALPTGKSGSLIVAQQERAEKEAEDELKRRETILNLTAKQAEMERRQEEALAEEERKRAEAAAKGAPKAVEYSPSEGRQYVFPDPVAAGVAGGRAPQVFRKDLGYGYIDDQDNFRQAREAPTGTRVVTSGALNPAAIAKFDERQIQFTDELIGLEKMQDYFKNVSTLDRGFKTLANKFTANLKNFLGKKIDGKEFDTLTADAKKEALLGALRLEVLGPGVLTEIDAQRLIRTLGGDVNQWFNPDLVASRLADIYKEKYQRTERLSRMLKRDSPFHGYDPEEFSVKLPSVLGGDTLREGKPRDRKPPPSGGARTPPTDGATTAPAATKVIRGKTWVLKKDAKGNMAYVSPDGKEFEEVR